MRLRSAVTFAAAVVAVGGALASPASAAAYGPYSISPVGLTSQCLYGQNGSQEGVPPVGIVPCGYTAEGFATLWDVVTTPGKTGQMLRGTGTDNCLAYAPSEPLLNARFQSCDSDNTRSRWILTVNDDFTTQIQSAADPTKCLFRYGPMAKVLECETPAANAGTRDWDFQQVV